MTIASLPKVWSLQVHCEVTVPHVIRRRDDPTELALALACCEADDNDPPPPPLHSRVSSVAQPSPYTCQPPAPPLTRIQTHQIVAPEEECHISELENLSGYVDCIRLCD